MNVDYELTGPTKQAACAEVARKLFEELEMLPMKEHSLKGYTKLEGNKIVRQLDKDESTRVVLSVDNVDPTPGQLPVLLGMTVTVRAKFFRAHYNDLEECLRVITDTVTDVRTVVGGDVKVNFKGIRVLV